MNISVIGKGHVGGGLARRWRAAGHTVDEIGRAGGDAAGADVLLVAVPSTQIGAALGRVSGLKGQVTIDATNAYGGREETHPSLAHQIKSVVGGPTAKAFNTNFAALYNTIDGQSVRPCNLIAADSAAREVAERLSRDAGYDPVFVGDLGRARMLEDHLDLMMAIRHEDGRPFFYRIYWPDA